MAETLEFDGKVALVSGGLGLLGCRVARRLAEEGATVILVDLASPVLFRKQFQKTFVTVHRRIHYVCCDITSEQKLNGMISRMAGKFPRIDILINNAALNPTVEKKQHGDSFFEPRLWRRAVDVNLTGQMLLTFACLPHMDPPSRGVSKIINVASMMSVRPPRNETYQRWKPGYVKPLYYPVTKAALVMCTTYLASHLAGRRITVNAISPGGIENAQPAAFRKSYNRTVPLRRMARLDEIVDATLFLSSTRSDYINGHNLVVDGGWSIA